MQGHVHDTSSGMPRRRSPRVAEEGGCRDTSMTRPPACPAGAVREWRSESARAAAALEGDITAALERAEKGCGEAVAAHERSCGAFL